MEPIARFALEAHDGPYKDWPLTSRLIVDGAMTDARVPGYVIEAQYRTPYGTLLITSFDCIFEESNSFVLLDDAYRIVASRDLLEPYGSWLLDGHWPEGPTTLVLHYQVRMFFRLQVMPPRPWWPKRPRLRLRLVRGWRRDPRMAEAHATLKARLEQIAKAEGL